MVNCNKNYKKVNSETNLDFISKGVNGEIILLNFKNLKSDKNKEIHQKYEIRN